jgi:hypothetical protein
MVLAKCGILQTCPFSVGLGFEAPRTRLAKNATKQNPFEIILLQPTRKENSWKTEETLERAVVTLETKRIKGSNP